ncbi:delta-60 repeat domain-containing protein [bacterium]|nr:delta-60 repeat domain-containing protein [bacterium]MBU1615238.1 delta-60 repeat domain-containing protein [bacterium]
MGGYFTTIGQTTRNYIARLNPDGTLDITFDSNVNRSVEFIVVQPDGKILIGGNFSFHRDGKKLPLKLL